MAKQFDYQNVLYVVVKNPNLLKKKEASGILSSLGLRTPLSKFHYLVISCFGCNYKYE